MPTVENGNLHLQFQTIFSSKIKKIYLIIRLLAYLFALFETGALIG